MADSPETIEPLRRQLAALREENELLTEQAEDIHLLGLIAEKIHLAEGEAGIGAVTVENLGLLKDLDFCAFCRLEGDGGLRLVDRFSPACPACDRDTVFPMAAAFFAAIRRREYFFTPPWPAPVPPCVPAELAGRPLRALLAVPVSAGGRWTYLLLVADYHDEGGHLQRRLAMVERICQVVEERLSTLALIDRINQLNRTLEETVRRRTAKLQESESRFRRFFEDHPLPSYMVAPDGTILAANEAAGRLLGRPPAQLAGQPLAAIYAPESHEQLAANLEEWRRRGRLSNVEMTVLDNQGRRRTVLLDATAVRDGAGKIVSSISVHRDVTEERELRQQLLQAQKMEAVGLLAGGVAHDFNNILTTIMGHAELGLLAAADVPAVQEHQQAILEAAQRAANLTRQLLAFSRKQVLEMRPLDCNRLVADLGKMLQRLLGEDIRLELHLAADPATVYGDAGQLEQVVMNLAVNARDAMPDGGRLLLETSLTEIREEDDGRRLAAPPGRYLVLAVSDTGAGIPEEIQDRVFEPFFTTKKAGHGTGLGLATVYGIVRQHHGDIHLYSEPGRGTTFRIYLPCHEEAAATAPADDHHPPPPAGTGQTILLVEDDDAVRRLNETALTSHGYRVVAAASGEEALAILRRQEVRPALLVTDVILPGMHGRALADSLRADFPTLPVLFVSGYNDNIIAHHGILDPDCNYLAKPFTPATLLQRVATLLA